MLFPVETITHLSKTAIEEDSNWPASTSSGRRATPTTSSGRRAKQWCTVGRLVETHVHRVVARHRSTSQDYVPQCRAEACLEVLDRIGRRLTLLSLLITNTFFGRLGLRSHLLSLVSMLTATRTTVIFNTSSPAVSSGSSGQDFHTVLTITVRFRVYAYNSGTRRGISTRNKGVQKRQ